MASLTRGNYRQIKVDTGTLVSLANQLKTVSVDLTGAAKAADRARSHEKWECGERYNVTNEVDQLKAHCERLARYIDSLSKILAQSAGEFETAQADIIAKMKEIRYTVD